MQILVLNGSPRPHGNTAAMVEAFRKGAEENGHVVTVVNVCQKKIAGCLACEYCHQEGSGHERQCVQKDDMQEVYPLLDEAEIIVLASPVYYHGFSGQLQCAINRIYALDKPKKLKKAALILSSGSDHVYSGAIYEYQNSFLNYLRLEDMGIYTAYDQQNRSPEKLEELYQFGRSLAPDVPAAPAPMPVPDFLTAFAGGGAGGPGSGGQGAFRGRCSGYSREALRIATELNNPYHTPEEIQHIFARLTGKPVNRTFSLFPPFYTDCGKNITLGQHVFINSGCRFQDQGGITIGDGALIGHNVVLATLNHGLKPEERHDLFPAPIHIGKNVWLGANVTVLGGVTIGDNVVIAAGAVVTRDVPANTVAAGVPARVVRTL
mgnify:CR=1 FL=1